MATRGVAVRMATRGVAVSMATLGGGSKYGYIRGWQ